MGDNAKVSWDWHNTVVGQGYQAKGVVRQRTGREHLTTNVLDLSQKESKKRSIEVEDKDNKKKPKESKEKKERKDKDKKKEKKNKKEKKHKKSDKHGESHDSKKKSPSHNQTSTQNVEMFNPLLQVFLSRLADSLADA